MRPDHRRAGTGRADYTARLGVDGSRIEQVRPVSSVPAESYRSGGTLVLESALEGVVHLGEARSPCT